jgi:RNase P protein component
VSHRPSDELRSSPSLRWGVRVERVHGAAFGRKRIRRGQRRWPLAEHRSALLDAQNFC